jgi:hypothetical protein
LIRSAVLSCLALLGAAVIARAADRAPSIRKLNQKEKEFVKEVGTAIVKAARSKPQKIEVEKYEFTNPRKNRTELSIKMVYYGLISRKKFTADITVLIDSTDKDNWEVMTIKYTDSNRNLVGPNHRKIEELIKRLNR